MYLCIMNADTRGRILEHNYEAMKLNGFQGLRTDKAISDLGITKGAFYHYFPDKKSLGYAIVEELVAPHYIGAWKDLVGQKGSVVEELVKRLSKIKGMCDQGNVHLGCPLNNLIQEMSPLDEGFQKRLQSIMISQKSAIQEAIAHDQSKGLIREGIDPEAMAFFILGSLEGAYTIGKSLQNKANFDQCMDTLIGFVRQLSK